MSLGSIATKVVLSLFFSTKIAVDAQSGEGFQVIRQSRRVICRRGGHCRLRVNRSQQLRSREYPSAQTFIQSEVYLAVEDLDLIRRRRLDEEPSEQLRDINCRIWENSPGETPFSRWENVTGSKTKPKRVSRFPPGAGLDVDDIEVALGAITGGDNSNKCPNTPMAVSMKNQSEIQKLVWVCDTVGNATAPGGPLIDVGEGCGNNEGDDNVELTLIFDFNSLHEEGQDLSHGAPCVWNRNNANEYYNMWCEQNCVELNHPACLGVSGAHQYCTCSQQERSGKSISLQLDVTPTVCGTLSSNSGHTWNLSVDRKISGINSVVESVTVVEGCSLTLYTENKLGIWITDSTNVLPTDEIKQAACICDRQD